MVDETYNFIMNRLNEASVLSGGPQRNAMGNLVESTVDFIWEQMQIKYPNVNSKIIVGKNKPMTTINSGKLIQESVDRHCYINNKVVACIECKTYLDKCYMQRADSDFALMKEVADFDAIIISLENGISDNSFNFFMNNNNIDFVFYLADGKRNSKKHISRHTEKMNKEKIAIFIDKIESYFKEAINVE